MVPDSSVSIVIPAYNEATTIADVLQQIRNISEEWEILVVDDGSTDDTAAVAEATGAKVVRHPYNLGNGASVKAGALAATRDYLVFMDADGQHPPESIPKLLEHLGEYDMVVGARTKKSKTSAVRNFGNKILIGIAELITGNTIDDLTSGFRAVARSRFFEFYHLYPKRYSYPSTITIAMFRSGYYVKFIPMDEIVARQGGKSGISPVRDGLKFINIMLRLTMMFAPQRLLTPMAASCFGFGVAFAIFQLIYAKGIKSASLFLMISGVIFFVIGLLAQQLVMLRDGLTVSESVKSRMKSGASSDTSE